MLLETVTSLFTQVLETLLNLLPELITAAVDAVMTIVGALIDNLPLLINAAIELVTALVEGIGMALPQLIPAAVSAVTQIEFFAIEEDSESKTGELADLNVEWGQYYRNNISRNWHTHRIEVGQFI